MKRFVHFLLVVAILLPFGVVDAANFTYEESVPTLLIGEVESGAILYEKDIDESRPMASMSKLMTYYVVRDQIKSGKLKLSDKVTISAHAASLARAGYSNFGLREGDQVTVESLLEGLMVVSGNDAAIALAEAVSGTEEAFAQKMNDKAASLGLTKAHFVNASGINDEKKGQNSISAREMFQLAVHLMKDHPEVLEYAKIRHLDVPERGYHGESTIPLTGDFPELDGLKTGYTDEAGYCFTSTIDLSKRNPAKDFRIVTVVMGCSTEEVRATMTKELIEYAEDRFEVRTPAQADRAVDRLKINSLETGYLDLYPKEDIRRVVRVGTDFQVRNEIQEDIEGPVKAGEEFGTLHVTIGDEEITTPIIAKKDQGKADLFTRIQRILGDFFDTLALMLMPA